MPSPVTIYFIPHTHWDREWYLTQKQFQYRLQSTVLEILDAMEAPVGTRVEKFTLDGQTVILDDLLAWQPELRPRIAKLIQSGRLEIGPWYSMPDLWLPTPEALRRNLARGRSDCAAWGVAPRRFIYIPDSFGMPSGMPGLLHAEGFDTVLFGRSQPPGLGIHSVDFSWSNPDGSSPITALALPNSYFSAALLPPARDQSRLRAWLTNLIEAHAHKAAPHLIGAFAGVDHIRIQRDLPEIIATLRGLFPAYRFLQATLSDYTQAVIDALPHPLSEYRGSLRGKLKPSELHGTWSTRQDIKSEDHFCSELLLRAEAIVREVEATGHALLKPPLAEAWTLLLQNQAHDSICGCSPDNTVADQLTRYRGIKQIATDVIEESLRCLANIKSPQERDLIFFPPPDGSLLNFAEIQVDTAGGPEPLKTDGRLLPSQLIATQVINRKDVALAYTEEGPTQELQTLTHRHHWLIQLPTSDRISFATFSIPKKRRPTAAEAKPVLSARRVANLITGLTAVRDVGGLYSHIGRGRSVAWLPHAQKLKAVEKGPLRWSYQLTLDYPELRLPRHAFGGKPLSLVREITVQLFPHLPLAIIEDAWAGQIEFARISLPLPYGNQETIVSRDELDQVCSDSLAGLKRVSALATADRAFFFRSWLELRSGAQGALTFFGNGLHEFSLSPPSQSGVAVTLLRAQGYVQVSADWPSPGAQFHGRRTLRYALWLGASTVAQKQQFSHELTIPTIAEPAKDYEPESVKGLGHATIETRIHGKPVVDSPTNWRPQPTYRSGWWQRSVRSFP